MTLFLKMEVVIVLGKSILVGRSCRLNQIVLFDFSENQKIRCPLFGRDLMILTYSVEPQFRHVSYLVGMCRRFCVNCQMHHIIIGTHLYTGCPSYEKSKQHKLLQVLDSFFFD